MPPRRELRCRCSSETWRRRGECSASRQIAARTRTPFRLTAFLRRRSSYPSEGVRDYADVGRSLNFLTHANCAALAVTSRLRSALLFYLLLPILRFITLAAGWVFSVDGVAW